MRQLQVKFVVTNRYQPQVPSMFAACAILHIYRGIHVYSCMYVHVLYYKVLVIVTVFQAHKNCACVLHYTVTVG